MQHRLVSSIFYIDPSLRSCHTVIGVPHELAHTLRVPLPVEPVQVDVAEQRGDNPALGRARDRRADHAVLHHPGTKHRTEELEDMAVVNAFLDHLHQFVVRDRLEGVGDTLPTSGTFRKRCASCDPTILSRARISSS
jgi:hypothetical protein